MNRLQNKVAIITGASSGIGRATALLFAAEGAKVVVGARRQPELESLVAEIERAGGAAVAVAGDVRSESYAKDLVAVAVKKFGRLDIAFNNAGTLGEAGDSTTVSEAGWNEALAINLTGSFLCCRAAFALMSVAGEGRIVTIASLSGVYATEKFPGLAAYNVSKYGVIGLTEAIAVEGRPHGISAICVSPGAVDTQMLRRANPELRPGLTPGDVAELILALLDSPLAPASGANIPLFSNA